MSKRVLVYGHYNHQNLGDELFKLAFKKIFPQYNYTFTDTFESIKLDDYDAIFFGGGSFLNQPIHGFNYEIPFNKIPIFYIGTGFETEIHIDHYYFLNKAKLITSRSNNGQNEIHKKQFNIINIPDLVYLLNENIKKEENIKKSNAILILPNVSILPQYDSPSWVTSSWENFKCQFAQFCDYLIDIGYDDLKFYQMCQNNEMHDHFVSSQIISMMKHRDYSFMDEKYDSEINEEILTILLVWINKFDFIITQRYHGIVLANMLNIQVLPIYHHDKLQISSALSYYEISKHRLVNSLNKLKKEENLINYSAFNIVRERVQDILKE